MGTGASLKRSLSGKLYKVKDPTGSLGDGSPGGMPGRDSPPGLNRTTSGASTYSASSRMCVTPTGVYAKIPQMKECGEMMHPSTKWQARVCTSRHLEVLSLGWSPDDELVAAAYTDGALRIWDVRSSKLMHTEHLDDSEDPECVARGIKYKAKDDLMEAPASVTAVRWRPEAKADRRELLAVDSDGTVFIYKVPSGENFKELTRIKEETFKHGSLVACDWVAGGQQVAVAGLSKVVCIYDAETRKPVAKLEGRPAVGMEIASHRSRILEVRAAAHDPNMILSAAWDHVAILWDIRAASVARSFTTPELVMNGGRPADISQAGDMVVTASDVTAGDISLWDTGGRGIVTSVPCLAARPTCVMFSRDAASSDIAAGSCGVGNCGMLKRAEKKRDSGEWRLDFTSWAGLSADVWAIDWANKRKQVCVGCTDGSLAILSEG